MGAYEALQKASNLRISGRPGAARAACEAVLRGLPSASGRPAVSSHETQLMAQALSELGSCCAAEGDVHAARNHSEAACRLYSQLLPEDHPVLQGLVGRLYCLAMSAAQAA